MSTADRSTTSLSRRAFLGWAGKGAGVVALGGVLRLVIPREEFLRPPGAVPEDEFLSLCTRCMKCQAVCPAYIKPVLITESLVAVGTPRLSRGCLRCMRCIPACPTGALRR